jgi:hypothetical protein
MYQLSDKEFQAIEATYLASKEPLRIKLMPGKEKKRYALVVLCSKLFRAKNVYSEREVNDILKPVYVDYALLRRYLVDYGFLDRKTNGSTYWVPE